MGNQDQNVNVTQMIQMLGVNMGIPFVSDAINAIGNIIGGNAQAAATSSANKSNIKYQKEFAQHGIQWKVADAKAAGIHPLAALGANTISFNPSVVADDKSWINRTGQSIGKAMGSLRTAAEKELSRLQIQKELEVLKRLKLENVGIAQKIKENEEAPTVETKPSGVFGVVGQSNAAGRAGVVESPLPPDYGYVEPSIEASSQMGIAYGHRPFYKYSVTPDGRAYLNVSKEMEESLENDLPTKMKYLVKSVTDHAKGLWHFNRPNTAAAKAWRNLLWTIRPKAPKGKEWRYNALGGYWKLAPAKGYLFDTKNDTDPRTKHLPKRFVIER